MGQEGWDGSGGLGWVRCWFGLGLEMVWDGSDVGLGWVSRWFGMGQGLVWAGSRDGLGGVSRWFGMGQEVWDVVTLR